MLTNVSFIFPSLISEQHTLFCGVASGFRGFCNLLRVPRGFTRGFRDRKSVDVV